MLCVFYQHFKDLSGPALSLCSIENQLWAQALLAGSGKRPPPGQDCEELYGSVCVCVYKSCAGSGKLLGHWSLPLSPHPPTGGKDPGGLQEQE